MHIVYFVLGVFGIYLSKEALLCVEKAFPDQRQGMLFGRVPWAILGIFWYVLIAVSFGYPEVRALLVGMTVPVTLWLIFKAYDTGLRFRCPFCTGTWALNALLVAVFWFT